MLTFRQSESNTGRLNGPSGLAKRTFTAIATAACFAIAGPASAEMNWKQAEGKSINLLLVAHPFVDSMLPLLPEFEKKTGINVAYEVLAEQPANEKLLADLSSRTGTYDLFMTSPLSNWQYATAGWLVSLDALISDPEKTDAEYDFDDFFPGIVNSGRWNRTPMQGLGEGDLWALPVNFEAYHIAYRPSLMKKHGLTVPETYADLVAMADKLGNTGSDSLFGIITRFGKDWSMPYLTFGTMLQSYGGQMIDEGGNLQICAPESVKATEDYLAILKAASPESAGSVIWNEAMQGFAAGQYIMAFNEADLFAPVYENPKNSSISDDVGYALTPLGPDGKRASAAWVWSMSMNSASKETTASWLFLQWLTSKDTMVKTHLGGNMNPVRISAWNHPDVAALVETWGETPGQYRKVTQEMGKVAALRFPPHPELTRMLEIWAGAIQKTYFGEGTVKENLCAAEAEIASFLGQ